MANELEDEEPEPTLESEVCKTFSLSVTDWQLTTILL